MKITYRVQRKLCYQEGLVMQYPNDRPCPSYFSSKSNFWPISSTNEVQLVGIELSQIFSL